MLKLADTSLILINPSPSNVKYLKTFWPNCVSRKSRKLDEIHISYKVEKPVLVAMLTHWTPRSFLVWFHALKNNSDTYDFHKYFHPWLSSTANYSTFFYIYHIQKNQVSSVYCIKRSIKWSQIFNSLHNTKFTRFWNKIG